MWWTVAAMIWNLNSRERESARKRRWERENASTGEREGQLHMLYDLGIMVSLKKRCIYIFSSISFLRIKIGNTEDRAGPFCSIKIWTRLDCFMCKKFKKLLIFFIRFHWSIRSHLVSEHPYSFGIQTLNSKINGCQVLNTKNK